MSGPVIEEAVKQKERTNKLMNASFAVAKFTLSAVNALAAVALTVALSHWLLRYILWVWRHT